ncbi:MAG: heme o synthase [Burkholderiales bacterium]|nr:heme o synthase [Burkholderiales bacterium]
MIKDYYSLTKPGIIYGNLITLCGGFFLASQGDIHWEIFIAAISGLSLVVACGCVFNNVIDRDIDKIMERTKNRPLAQGVIPVKNALLFAVILGVIGSAILLLGTNKLTALVAVAGLFIYVIIYSYWLKRCSMYATLVGSISGAIPPVAGYCAVTNSFDLGALILFLILGFWQMPHSYAIAIYRLNDYRFAQIPVLPIKKGIAIAKIHMLIYAVLFVMATIMLTLCNYTGISYLIIGCGLGVYWLWLIIKGVHAHDNKKWARTVFLFSILVITILAVMMSIDYIGVTHTNIIRN